MNRYADLTDTELAAKIKTLSEAVEGLDMGGKVAVVAGRGRRMEYTQGSRGNLDALLREAMKERAGRAGVNVSGAIEVRF